MRVQVLILRSGGSKLTLPRPASELRIGVLRFVRAGRGDGVPAVELAQLASAPGMGVVATLFEPIVEGVDHACLRLRGIERAASSGQVAAYVQEWLVDVPSADRPGARPA